MSRYLFVLVGAVALATPGAASAQPSTTVGKSTVWALDNAPFGVNPFSDPDIAELHATGPKAKRHRLLVVNTLVVGQGTGTCTRLDSYMLFNGFGTFPSDAVGRCPNGDCSLAGSFTYDIDALEALSPGSFFGKPMDLVLRIFRTAGDTCAVATSQFTAQLIKK